MAKDKEQKGKKGGQQAPLEEKPSGRPRHSSKERPRLKVRFEKEVAPALMKEFELKNPMAVPHLNKIVVNMGVGEATQNAKVLGVENFRGQHGSGRSHAERESSRPRRQRIGTDYRSETRDYQGEEINCCLQSTCRHAHRRDGDAARRSYV